VSNALVHPLLKEAAVYFNGVQSVKQKHLCLMHWYTICFTEAAVSHVLVHGPLK